MTISAENSAVQAAYFDPYDVDLNADPYPMFRRLREERPLYYNEQHDFYAISRFEDVDNAIVDNKTFISGKGAILEIIKGWANGQPTDPPNTAFVPMGWTQKPQLYQDVVARSCRTCHVAFNSSSPTSGISWAAYSQFSLRKGTIQFYTCGDSKYMPHALMTYRNFWLSLGPHRPDVLANELGLSGGCQ